MCSYSWPFMNPSNSHQMIIQCLWGARLKHPHCCVPASWGPARLMCGESGEFCLPQQSWGVQYDAECSHPSTTTLHQSWTDRPVNMRGSPRSDTLQPGDTPLHITGNTHDHQVCLRLCLCICLWDGSGYQSGWIFGSSKRPLPPPSFSENFTHVFSSPRAESAGLLQQTNGPSTKFGVL